MRRDVMRRHIVSVLVFGLVLCVTPAAQRGGGGGGVGRGGGGGGRGVGGGGRAGGPLGVGAGATPFGRFIRELNLNEPQTADANRMFGAAVRDGDAIAVAMADLRLQMISRAQEPAELEAAIAAYAEQATKMAALEWKVLRQVQTVLNDSQKKRSGAAYVAMAGAFHPPMPTNVPGPGGEQ
jgi:hypothetical protein